MVKTGGCPCLLYTSSVDRKPIEKQFLKYVVPSMFTMLLSGFYTIVDEMCIRDRYLADQEEDNE